MNDLTPETIRDLWPTWWLIRRLAYWFLESVPNVVGRGDVLESLARGEAGHTPETATALCEELGEWWRGYGSPDPPTD